jgi:hypothetical protein
VAHITDDDLEEYAMRTLPDAESEPLKQHFLVCSECRDRLTATDEYLAAMRSAAAEIRAQGREPDGVEESVGGSHHHG